MSIPRKQLWPYDEVRISGDAHSSDPIAVTSPWLKIKVDVQPDDRRRILELGERIAEERLDASDIEDIQWFFQSLAKYPLSYILPRPQVNGSDEHIALKNSLVDNSPLEMLKSLVDAKAFEKTIDRFSSRTRGWKWTWDTQAALEFSLSEGGHDPETLFSVGRRFHLLNDLEWNKTGEMLAYVKSLKDDTEKFQYASALIVRQNHYITEQCDSVLRSALPTSQSAFAEVTEFIQAETGHDKILGKAIKSLGSDASSIPAIDTVVVLMEVFREIAKRNFLAFALVVDIFERTSYKEEDPLANLLRAGGLEAAARQADVHREINDSGEHENVALGFLADMKAVDSEYAIEALQLAELATLTIHQLSAETLDVLRAP